MRSTGLKMASYLTLDRIAAAVVEDGIATASEVHDLKAALLAFTEDPTTLLSVPRIVQTWGFVRCAGPGIVDG